MAEVWLAYMWKKKEQEFAPITLHVNREEMTMEPGPTKLDDVLKINDPKQTTSSESWTLSWMLLMLPDHPPSRRLGVLRGSYLFFFKDEKLGTPTCLIPLRECKSIDSSPGLCNVTVTFTDSEEYPAMNLVFTSPSIATEWREDMATRITLKEVLSKKDSVPTREDFASSWPKKGILITTRTKLLEKAAKKPVGIETAPDIPIPESAIAAEAARIKEAQEAAAA